MNLNQPNLSNSECESESIENTRSFAEQGLLNLIIMLIVVIVVIVIIVIII
jgi:hypothetical protein